MPSDCRSTSGYKSPLEKVDRYEPFGLRLASPKTSVAYKPTGKPIPLANDSATLCAVKQDGFVFSKEQIERHAQHLMRDNSAYYAVHSRFQPDPPPTRKSTFVRPHGAEP